MPARNSAEHSAPLRREEGERRPARRRALLRSPSGGPDAGKVSTSRLRVPWPGASGSTSSRASRRPKIGDRLLECPAASTAPSPPAAPSPSPVNGDGLGRSVAREAGPRRLPSRGRASGTRSFSMPRTSSRTRSRPGSLMSETGWRSALSITSLSIAISWDFGRTTCSRFVGTFSRIMTAPPSSTQFRPFTGVASSFLDDGTSNQPQNFSRSSIDVSGRVASVQRHEASAESGGAWRNRLRRPPTQVLLGLQSGFSRSLVDRLRATLTPADPVPREGGEACP